MPHGTDILFLRKKGLLDLPYSDYLKKFPNPSEAIDFIKKRITPDKIDFFDTGSIPQVLQTLKTALQSFHHISYVPSQQTFLTKKGHGDKCMESIPILNSLPEMLQPSYFSGNFIYNTFKERIGEITPLGDEKALFKMGEFEKEISWNPDCYHEEVVTSIVNVLSTCWLCPIYDFFYQAISVLSYKVWTLFRQPILILIGLLFPLLIGFKLLKKLMGFDVPGKEFIQDEILPNLLRLSAVVIIILLAEVGYDFIQQFISLILEPISNFSVYISGKFLNKETCEYIPLAVETHEFMFSATLKNDLLCVVEQLLSVFMDYLIISAIILIILKCLK